MGKTNLPFAPRKLFLCGTKGDNFSNNGIPIDKELIAEIESSSEPDKALLIGFAELWEEADQIWESHQDATAFGTYVSANFLAVYQSLAGLRGRVETVLEWGSGLGVVTIMASQMGFEAYGIEAEQELVTRSQTLADKYGPAAQFVVGSFIPDEFEWILDEGDEAERTFVDLPGAYGQLDMELRDFDLIYAYPWPEEHRLYQNIVKNLGRSDAMLLTYDGREGMELTRFN